MKERLEAAGIKVNMGSWSRERLRNRLDHAVAGYYYHTSAGFYAEITAYCARFGDGSGVSELRVWFSVKFRGEYWQRTSVNRLKEAKSFVETEFENHVLSLLKEVEK